MAFLRRSLIFSVFVAVLTTTPCRADVVVTLGNIDLAPGGIGTMDIDATSMGGDTLSSIGLELLITPISGATSLLQFTSSSPDPFSNPNYVLSGASLSSDLSIPFWAPPTESSYPSDTISGGDSSDGSGSGYATIGSSVGDLNTFVAAVQFQAPAMATLGDAFQVSLVNDPSFTYFDDANGDALTIHSVSGGLVTVAASVPEPSTITLLSVAFFLLVACGRRGAAPSRETAWFPSE